MAAVLQAPLQDGIQQGDIKSKITTLSWVQWFTQIFNLLNPGLSVTITTAKLTGGGTVGSMTFVNGILTKSTPAT